MAVRQGEINLSKGAGELKAWLLAEAAWEPDGCGILLILTADPTTVQH